MRETLNDRPHATVRTFADGRDLLRMTLVDMEALATDTGLAEGPFKTTFGTGYGEPYCPPQVFGTTREGTVVWCWEREKDRLEGGE